MTIQTNNLYEILIPTHSNAGKKFTEKYHKKWDKYIHKFSSGLTILQPAKGQWIDNSELFVETMIPVRIMCDKSTIEKIAQYSMNYYKQKAIMYYKISDEAFIIKKKP